VLGQAIAVQVDVPLPVKPRLQVPQVWFAALVQVRPDAQLGIAAQAGVVTLPVTPSEMLPALSSVQTR
jgi:hypothetical protein